MILAWDTETTGLPLYSSPSMHPNQPHIVQLALVQHNDAGEEIEAESIIVRPNGWVISPQVAAIHGITHERAMDEGVSERVAVIAYVMAQAQATHRVAHNLPFDDRIMRIAMLRFGVQKDLIETIERRAGFDTCRAAAPIVNLPPTEKMRAAGFKNPKSPKLGECFKHFFGEELAGAHDALVDARACARIYFKLKGVS